MAHRGVAHRHLEYLAEPKIRKTLPKVPEVSDQSETLLVQALWNSRERLGTPNQAVRLQESTH